MNILKSGNLIKLIAFLAIAGILTCTVAFAASGRQSFSEDEPDSGNADGDKLPPNGEADENKDGDNDNVVEAPVIKYYHYITGEEIANGPQATRPVCFSFSNGAPLYGISSSYLTVEMPTENSETRFLMFTDDADSLGKIGSIAPIRGYITNVAAAFGAALIYRGCDDSFDYQSRDYKSESIDLETNVGYSYTEFSSYCYSNADLISALLKNTNTSVQLSSSVRAPYIFAENVNDKVSYEKGGTDIQIAYSEANTTSFSYDTELGEYTVYKNGSAMKDMLNDRSLSYDNVFVLFADSVTYETADATESIIDTASNGCGYYFTNGTIIKIQWTVDDNGNLRFVDPDGELLTVNRGTSYISYVKSSQADSVTFI